MTKFLQWLLFFMLLSTPALAGIVVCHSGEDITDISISSPPVAGCEYLTDQDLGYDSAKDLIKTVRKKYLKWTTQLEEMTQAEKDAFDQARLTTKVLETRSDVKKTIDNGSDEGVRLRAALLVIMEEMNIRRQQPGLADRTVTQLKNAIKSKIDSGAAD